MERSAIPCRRAGHGAGTGGGRGRGSQSGFTLIELMVVIVIIGVAATALLLVMPEPGGSLQSEAERLAARARAARDGAIIEARPAALTLGPGGYDIARRSERQWRSVARHEWEEGTEPELAPGSAARTVFDTTGLADPLHLTLRRGERRVGIEIGHDGSIQIRR